MDYGYPGNASYRHERPFDYFRIESSVSAEGLEHLSTRGLIAGTDYGAGRLSGIWGLYGTYDYFAPDDFRFSSTAVSFGTTLQASISESLVVQSSGLVGGGYAAAHSVDQTDGRDYHYGVAPQALANLRLIAGRRAALDLTAREYFVSAVGGFGTGQRDLIFVGDASLAVRLYRRHALGLTYQLAGRSSDYLSCRTRRKRGRRSASSTRSSARAASARCGRHYGVAYWLGHTWCVTVGALTDPAGRTPREPNYSS